MPSRVWTRRSSRLMLVGCSTERVGMEEFGRYIGFTPNREPQPIGITFGGLAPRLQEQLRGIKCHRGSVVFHQRCADAIVLLSVQGLLSETARERAEGKLVQMILESIR